MKQTGSQLASIGAVLISVAALAIGIIQAQIMNEQQKIMAEQQKASVWPYVDVDKKLRFSDGASNIEIYLENKGVGPAVVRNMELHFNGSRYSDFIGFLEALSTEEIKVSSDLKFFISADLEKVLRSSERQLIFQISSDSLTAEQQKSLAGIEISLCYCSVHGDCWGANGKDLKGDGLCQ